MVVEVLVCADSTAARGGGIQNYGKHADVILELPLRQPRLLETFSRARKTELFVSVWTLLHRLSISGDISFVAN